MEDYLVGNIVKGKVTGIEPYGVFIKVDNKVDGMVHISEITNNFVKDINSWVTLGDEVYAKIIDIDFDKNCNYTSGKIYSSIISKERRGEYLGATIQVVPHVTG